MILLEVIVDDKVCLLTQRADGEYLKLVYPMHALIAVPDADWAKQMKDTGWVIDPMTGRTDADKDFVGPIQPDKEVS